MKILLGLLLILTTSTTLSAQNWVEEGDKKTNLSQFRAIDTWPQPNDIRQADGQPGAKYWQQQADYKIEVSLDTVLHSITGSEVITYHNNSPNTLKYVWVQLDQNVRSLAESRDYARSRALPENASPRAMAFFSQPQFDGGYTLSKVQTQNNSGKMVDARHIINNTVMKIHLEQPLAPGQKTDIRIDWSNKIPDSGRGAKEKVKDGWMYQAAQWFPRMSVYDDVNGWQTDQFLGRGEFYLNFGNYDVKITVPWNHIVESTGVLQNPETVLTKEQIKRLKKALKSEEPVFIVGPDEVMDPKTRPVNKGTLTWHFVAENVRDFAWVSSKTYVWDAAGYKYNKKSEPIACYSIYPRDAMPLWDKVSTRATVQTMKTYGKMSFEYPYPKAVNVHGPVFGMEYPMIAFCGARPDEEGNYSEALERALISVTIHEVGHNWFPMIVATDERTWSWMDEGINSFLQYYTEQEWQEGYPSRRGPAKNIVAYMQNEQQVPIMTHSDVIQTQFGNNAYSKPAAGLVLLREQILKPEVFDEAFREFSQTWAFKHPQPADFFRSIEQGAGEDLAFFWRGWFYTTNANDQAITDVTVQKTEEILGKKDERGDNYYRIKVENKGKLLLPIQIEVRYTDGSSERFKIPADAWRDNELEFVKGLFTNKEVDSVMLDPDEVLADINVENNEWKNPEIVREEKTESDS